MGQRERIEISNPCPQTPSLKRSLETQGIRKSLNLHVRPNPILVAVSLTLIFMVSGLVFLLLLMDILYPWEELGDMGGGMYRVGFYDDYNWFFIFAYEILWGITLLAGLMIIKKKLNLHSRPHPIRVAGSLTLFFMVSGLVIIIWIACISGYFGLYFWVSLIIWPGVALLVGVIVFGPDVTGRIDRGQTGVREFNKIKATSTLVEEERGERKRGEERKLKHLKTTFLVVLLIVIGVAITPQFAETAGDASSIMNLKGPRIWIAGEGVPESGEYTISADEYAHLHAGWNSCGQYYPKINWSELSELEKNEYIETSTFELTIDGDPIELSCAQWLDSELDRYFVIYYIQFKPGDLAIGNHTFSGTWYSEVYGEPYSDDDYGTCPVTSTVTVNVV